MNKQYPAPRVIRYQCSGYVLNRDHACCIMFGGLRADRLVSEQLVQCLAIAVYREGERRDRDEISVSEVAVVLGVTPTTVLRMIRLKQLSATQACVGAPWILRRVDVERYMSERNRPATPPTVDLAQLILEIP